MTEQACEAFNTCDNDQLSFKAYFSAWLAATTTLAPFTSASIFPLLSASAKAAALQCNGGSSQSQCGFKWTTNGVNDGNFGIGQSMGALAVIQSAVVAVPRPAGETASEAPSFAPVTNSTGGTSVGDPNAGISKVDTAGVMEVDLKVTVRDKVAASFLTVAVLGGVIGGSVVMVLEG